MSNSSIPLVSRVFNKGPPNGCCFQLTVAETVLTVLCDRFPRTLSRRRMLITAVLCGAMFVLALPFVTQVGEGAGWV